MVYDGNGNPTQITDQLNQITTMEYDKNGNVIVTTTPDGKQMKQSYNCNNQVVTVTDKMGYTTTYEYDVKGQLTKQTDPEGGSVSLKIKDFCSHITLLS